MFDPTAPPPVAQRPGLPPMLAGLAKILAGGGDVAGAGAEDMPSAAPSVPTVKAPDAPTATPPFVPPTSGTAETSDAPPKSLQDAANISVQAQSGPTPPPDILAASKAPEVAQSEVPESLRNAIAPPPSRVPTLAPPQHTFADKLRAVLPIIGMVGAGLEAGGNRGEAPNAARLQATLQNQRATALQQERLRQVEEPETQAHIRLQDAQANSATATVPITVNGVTYPVRRADLAKVLGAQIGENKGENVQKLKNTGAGELEDKRQSGRMDIQQLKMQILQGKVARVLDGQDESGKPVKLAYNAQNKLIGTVEGALPSSQYLPKSTNTVQYMADAAGNIQALPKTSTSSVQLPGGGGIGNGNPAQTTNVLARGKGGAPNRTRNTTQPPQANSAAPIQARPVNGANGQPMVNASSTKWMQWQDPVTGRDVAGPMSMVPPGTNPAQLPAQEVRDLTNARHAVNLLTKKGDPAHPDTNGVLQLIEGLDHDGKLGVLASRWNKFMTSGIGTSPGDDPRIITLLNKNMLGDTAAMLAHFGAAGGRSPQMLQHFKDLADAGKMDGITLRAGTLAMADYMKDRAMLPEPSQRAQQPAQNAQPTHVVKNAQGQRIGTVVNNTFVPDK